MYGQLNNHIPERPSLVEAAQIMALHTRRVANADAFKNRARAAKLAREEGRA